MSSFTLIFSTILVSCLVCDCCCSWDFAGLVPPEDAVDAIGRDAVVVVDGAEVLATLHATTVLVAVLEEAVGAAEVTVCCDCAGAEEEEDAAAMGTAVTGTTFDDGGVAVVMVEFWLERQIPVTWRGVFRGVLQHRGERTHLLSALRG